MMTSLWIYIIWIIVIACFILFISFIIEMYGKEQLYLAFPPSPEVISCCEPFILDNDILRDIMSQFYEQILLGLNHYTRSKSTVKCFVTYVQDLPTGNETGKYLALDLGGTNFRVILVTLDGKGESVIESKIYVVPENIMVATGEQLFDHIATCLLDFLKFYKIENERLSLGFTFSFPLEQVGLEKGILQKWTKGFNCSNTVGKDVVEMLKEALHRNKAVLNVVAVLNDTTGTLMSCAYKYKNCRIGCILGTGSNACYVEKISNIIDFDGDLNKEYVIINTEWGAFGDDGQLDYLRTPFDIEVDEKSINPGKQLFEKMISGMYLGEIARLIMVKMVKDKKLFIDQNTINIERAGSFLTSYISDIESDMRGSFEECRQVLKLFSINPTIQDCIDVRYICERVAHRAANLASAGLATLMNKMDFTDVTIGMDGSLYRHHPHFKKIITHKLKHLIHPKILNFNIVLSHDGSGRGAALVAASATQKN